jgi:hypothetical protein
MHILEKGDVDEASDCELAQHIGRALQDAYPDHPWVVGFQGRALVIRHLGIASEVHRVIGRDGFAARLDRAKLGTPKQVSHSATMMGGQLLEAFGLPRGRWDGRTPQVPVAWGYKKEKDFT